MVFWGRKQIFSGLVAAVLGVFFIQMRVDAQIPQREEDVAPEREMMEQQAAEAARGVRQSACSYWICGRDVYVQFWAWYSDQSHRFSQ